LRGVKYGLLITVLITTLVDHCGDRGGRLRVGILEEVAVTVLREGCRSVTEAASLSSAVAAGRDQVSDVRVAEVMEPEPLEPERATRRSNTLATDSGSSG